MTPVTSELNHFHPQDPRLDNLSTMKANVTLNDNQTASAIPAGDENLLVTASHTCYGQLGASRTGHQEILGDAEGEVFGKDASGFIQVDEEGLGEGCWNAFRLWRECAQV